MLLINNLYIGFNLSVSMSRIKRVLDMRMDCCR